MLINLASTTAIATAMLALTATGAGAQQNPQTNDQTKMAEACLLEMNEFAERMYEDEFWLSGWGTGAYGAPPAPQSTESPATTAPAAGDTTTSRATSAEDVEAGDMDPRGEVVGIDAPRYQIRALYGAGRVLAHRGDNEGCEYIVAKMNEVYDSYSQQLEEAGVDPASVTTWRQERLALAEPLAADATTRYRIDNITGTDVRNMEDENLGSVSDVVIDPESGKAAYVIVARGGFLGMGEDHYAIPWDEVRATPGLEVVVVDRTAAELEDAPSIDPDRFRDPGMMMDERRTTDEFWTQRG